MKTIHHIFTTAAAASMMALCACSFFESKIKPQTEEHVEDYSATADDGSASAIATGYGSDSMTAADSTLMMYCEVLNSPELKAEILSDAVISDFNASVSGGSLILNVRLTQAYDRMSKAEVEELTKEFNYTIPESFKVGLQSENPFVGTDATFVINLIDSKNDTINSVTPLSHL